MKIRIANKKKFFIVISLLLVVIIATVAGFNFFIGVQNPVHLFEAEKKDDEKSDINEKFDKNKINILFFGLDKNEQRDTEAQYSVYRSDTIMLVTLDFKEKAIDIVSLPRDTYVPIYNTNEKAKINACFAYGKRAAKTDKDVIPTGIKYLSKTVSNVLGGIPINYYVGITDMEVVTQIVDELGGIEIDVLHTLYADQGKDYSKVEIKKGGQKLNGKDLQYYARYRAYPLGDIDRVSNQQHIIKALMSNIKSTNSLVKLPQIYKLVSDNLITNLSLKQITSLSLFGSKVEKESLETYTLPGDFGDLGGLSYWIINQNKKTKLIKDIYGINAKGINQDAKNDKLSTLSATIDKKTLQVGEVANLTIEGKTGNGQNHRFVINDTTYSVSQDGIVQLNADNTIVAKEPGDMTLSISVQGIKTAVSITVQGEKEPESEIDPALIEQKSTDTAAPLLAGVDNVQVKVGQLFDSGAGVTIEDEDPNAKWSSEGTVNTNQPGEYPIVYKARDTSGNITSITRTITVVE